MPGQNQRAKKRVAIVIPMDEPVDYHHGPYRGIMRYAAERGDWQTILDPHLAGATHGQGLAEYDGVVGRIDQQMLAEAREARVPVVNHWMNTPARDMPNVFTDYKAGATIAAEHFIARGFKRVGMITFTSDRSKPALISGLRETLDANGMDLHLLDAPFYFEGSRKNFLQFNSIVRQWLSELTPPLGIYVHYAAMALYVMQVADQLGLHVPNDVGIVVGHSNATINTTTTPTLSSVEANNERMGYLAARQLDRLMRGAITEPVETVLVPPVTLHVRGSSDAFVSENPIVAQAMRYISDHAREPIRIDDVANAVHSSKRTLERYFKQHHDRSIGSEIIRLRVETIKRLLIHTDQPVGKIAQDCGFASSSHFSRYFRNEVGMSPREFRTQQTD